MKELLYDCLGGWVGNILSTDILGLIDSGYANPLVALILAHCPNLGRLLLHNWEIDPFLKWILQVAVSSTSHGKPPGPGIAFQNLDTLSLWARYPTRGSIDYPQGSVYLSEEHPYYLLPRLKDLTVSRVKFGIDFIVLDRCTTIEKLTFPTL